MFDVTNDEQRKIAIILGMEQGVLNSMTCDAFSEKMSKMIMNRAEDIIDNQVMKRQKHLDFAGAFSYGVLYLAMNWMAGGGIEKARERLNEWHDNDFGDDTEMFYEYWFAIRALSDFMTPVISGISTYTDAINDMRSRTIVSGVNNMQRIFKIIANVSYIHKHSYNDDLATEASRIVYDLETLHLSMQDKYPDMDEMNDSLSMFLDCSVTRMIMLESILVSDINHTGHLLSYDEMEPIRAARKLREDRVFPIVGNISYE